MKLSHKAFIELNDDLIQAYYETATLYEFLTSKILKSLSAIRPNRKFIRKERTFVPKKYPMSYKRMR
jgi:hypothetical protein